MSELALPGAVLLLSILATYWFCLRPMRRGHCGLAGGLPRRGEIACAEESDGLSAADVARLREEIRALQSQIGAAQRGSTASTGADHLN